MCDGRFDDLSYVVCGRRSGRFGRLGFGIGSCFGCVGVLCIGLGGGGGCRDGYDGGCGGFGGVDGWIGRRVVRWLGIGGVVVIRRGAK